ncbi:unnamed protein product [Protopolystoma xenopodis]|uniref:Uncharacterized protein n=1 Tax=Protopolystoma xenopodis TaxID=117903 RepID=A0A448XJ19_9PLAT|nr:unnamed protein product [Protopolystoma xenopodis]
MEGFDKDKRFNTQLAGRNSAPEPAGQDGPRVRTHQQTETALEACRLGGWVVQSVGQDGEDEPRPRGWVAESSGSVCRADAYVRDSGRVSRRQDRGTG